MRTIVFRHDPSNFLIFQDCTFDCKQDGTSNWCACEERMAKRNLVVAGFQAEEDAEPEAEGPIEKVEEEQLS